MRCIEMRDSQCALLRTRKDKLQHEMYWNALRPEIPCSKNVDKLQHEMYWNNCSPFGVSSCRTINYNMRCIEMRKNLQLKGMDQDKLQHEMYWNSFGIQDACQLFGDKLQHEMYWNFSYASLIRVSRVINYNMRCIEMIYNHYRKHWVGDKLQHEMYWNFHSSGIFVNAK